MCDKCDDMYDKCDELHSFVEHEETSKPVKISIETVDCVAMDRVSVNSGYGCDSKPDSCPPMQEKLDINQGSASNESRIWDEVSRLYHCGHDEMEPLSLFCWMQGHMGLYEGCHIKKCIALAIKMCD